METFLIGDTIKFRLTVKKYNGDKISADTTPTVIVYNSNNSTVGTVTVSEGTTGVYTGQWTIPSNISTQNLIAKADYKVGGYNHRDSVSFPVEVYNA